VRCSSAARLRLAGRHPGGSHQSDDIPVGLPGEDGATEGGSTQWGDEGMADVFVLGPRGCAGPAARAILDLCRTLTIPLGLDQMAAGHAATGSWRRTSMTGSGAGEPMGGEIERGGRRAPREGDSIPGQPPRRALAGSPRKPARPGWSRWNTRRSRSACSPAPGESIGWRGATNPGGSKGPRPAGRRACGPRRRASGRRAVIPAGQAVTRRGLNR